MKPSACFIPNQLPPFMQVISRIFFNHHVQIVVECVEIAAAVAECLASVTDIDKLHVSDLCTKFINYIKVWLPHVLIFLHMLDDLSSKYA